MPGGRHRQAAEEAGEEDQLRRVGGERGVDGLAVGVVVGERPAAEGLGRDAGAGGDLEATHPGDGADDDGDPRG